MKKLLFQLDTDIHPAVFDTVVAYDGGADHVIGHGGVTPENVRSLVEGAIFTRAPKEKHNTAFFIGGSDMAAGEKLLAAIERVFFADFRVSVMLDSNGSNTTAAAAVARLSNSGEIKGKKAVILAGTGPVGQRAAVMLARQGAAEVIIGSRRLERAAQVSAAIKRRFEVETQPAAAPDFEARAALIRDAQIVLATGAAGVELLRPEHWRDNPNIELMADANATPPLGIGGIDMLDKGKPRHGKIIWGAIGFGALKIALHRACIAELFKSNDQRLDAEKIFSFARAMA